MLLIMYSIINKTYFQVTQIDVRKRFEHNFFLNKSNLPYGKDKETVLRTFF